MNTLVSLQEIHYASTEVSILSDRPGFGIRTHTEGMDAALIEKVTDSGVFQYQSGSLSLATTAELMDDPACPMRFPRSYRFAVLEVKGVRWGMFGRSIFLGRDFPYYIPGQADRARSGNIHAHVFLWPIASAPLGNMLLSLYPLFEPRDWSNHPVNTELLPLLTGHPVLLPPRSITLGADSNADSKLQPIEESVLRSWVLAQANGTTALVHCEDQYAWPILVSILPWLPQPLAHHSGFVTNWHGTSSPPAGTLIFQNQHHFQTKVTSEPYLAPLRVSGSFFGERFVRAIMGDAESKRHHTPRYIQDIVNESVLVMPSGTQWDVTWMAVAYAWELEDFNLLELETAMKQVDWNCISSMMKVRVLERTAQLFKDLVVQRKLAPAGVLLRIIVGLRDAALVPEVGFSEKYLPLVEDWLRDQEACKVWPKDLAFAQPLLNDLHWDKLVGDANSILRNTAANPTVATYFLQQFLRVTPQSGRLSLLAEAVRQAAIPRSQLRELIASMDADELKSHVLHHRFLPDWEPGLRDDLLGDIIASILSDAIIRNQLGQLAQKADPRTHKGLGKYFLAWATATSKPAADLIQAQIDWEKVFGEIDNDEGLACDNLDNLVREGSISPQQLHQWAKVFRNRKNWTRRVDFLQAMPVAKNLGPALSMAMAIDNPHSPTLAIHYLSWVFDTRNNLLQDDHPSTATTWFQAFPQPVFVIERLKLNGWECYLALLLTHLSADKERVKAIERFAVELRKAWSSASPRNENKARDAVHFGKEEAIRSAKSMRMVASTLCPQPFGAFLKGLEADKSVPRELYDALKGSTWDRFMKLIGR